MANIVGGQEGQQTLTSGASNQPLRQGRYADLIASELNAKYYEQAYRGNVFFAAHQAAITFAANGLTSSTVVGLGLFNTVNSGKNIIPIQVEITMTNYVTTSTNVQVVAVATAAASTASPTVGGGLTIYQSVGMKTNQSIAIAAQTMTFSANTVVWKSIYGAFCNTTISDAIPTVSSEPVDLGGSLVIPPGMGMGFLANNASTGLISLTWMELAI